MNKKFYIVFFAVMLVEQEHQHSCYTLTAHHLPTMKELQDEALKQTFANQPETEGFVHGVVITGITEVTEVEMINFRGDTEYQDTKAVEALIGEGN